MKPICITVGDIAGIGPEVTIKSLQKITAHPPIILFLHSSLLPMVEAQLSISPYNGDVSRNNIYYVIVGENHHPVMAPNHSENAKIAYDALIQALEICKNYNCALVTGPISKAGFLAAGIPFTGHTTLLKNYFKCPEASMAFYSKKLKVILATIHIPLSDVEKSLTQQQLLSTIKNAQLFAKNIQLEQVRIAIAGLNPHASENGQFGTFESSIMKPSLASVAPFNGTLTGPISPDAVFRQTMNGTYDIVIALYHDQGLIPLKMIAFDSAVNVTIGLPICRTSPDHGTAYDIAGKNIANPDAMIAAINYAIKYG